MGMFPSRWNRRVAGTEPHGRGCKYHLTRAGRRSSNGNQLSSKERPALNNRQEQGGDDGCFHLGAESHQLCSRWINHLQTSLTREPGNRAHQLQTQPENSQSSQAEDGLSWHNTSCPLVFTRLSPRPRGSGQPKRSVAALGGTAAPASPSPGGGEGLQWCLSSRCRSTLLLCSETHTHTVKTDPDVADETTVV